MILKDEKPVIDPADLTIFPWNDSDQDVVQQREILLGSIHIHESSFCTPQWPSPVGIDHARIERTTVYIVSSEESPVTIL